jgi:23S rRNA pseudouridine1911/1915/1917 synthase
MTPDRAGGRDTTSAVAAPPITFSVAVDGAERLDRFLADQLQLSRTVAARLIAERRVTVGGAPARASLQPARRTEIAVAFPETAPRRVVPADIPLVVVYEDDALAVIDKPAGLVVHPAPGHWDDTLVNALAARGLRLGGGEQGRPGIVHRLDKDTSGLLVVAKTEAAHRRLGAALAARRITRRYAALVWGHLGPGERRLDQPVARHPRDRKRMTVHHGPGARPAVTRVRTVARGTVADLVEARLETGRTHQIRVHLSSIGHPVVGDPVYGGRTQRRADATRALAEALARATPRQALHAAYLELPHPLTGKPLRLRSEWPADLREALACALGEIADSNPLQYVGFFASGEPR